MDKNEVVKKDAIEEDAKELVENIVVVKDLTSMVKLAKYEEVKFKYGVRHPYYVTLFNDKKIEFIDSDGFYDLLISYAALGEKNFVKSKSLVEEVKVTEDGTQGKSYICVKYELADGSIFRLFPRNFLSRQVILNYFNLFEKTKSKASN